MRSSTVGIVLTSLFICCSFLMGCQSVNGDNAADKAADKAQVKRAIAARQAGDYATAIKEFEALANRGDEKAMIEVGVSYYQGQGVKQDYDKAMDWFLMAFKKGNGDAYNNIGVMYRDGLGVEKNVKIAYDLFWIVHMNGMGTESTQYRAGNNLGKADALLKKEERDDALKYTVPYITAYVENRGKNQAQYEALKSSPKHPPILEMARIGDKIVMP